ncbi:MAG TPA: hypoxanthine phosphoribosyltransferase [Phycisphaerae bacterium]|nr:hypoxanthine phosphoribosyltransferase [Phycisphaerae bacterium]
MNTDLDRILIPRERIAGRVKELARDIAATYDTRTDIGITIVTILSGSLIFLADLIRELPFRMKIALITVSSYRGATTTPGGARIDRDLNVDVAGRHVLLVDDILDTGGTLRLVRERLAACGAESIRTCVLLRKPSKAPADVPAEFVGFDIADDFVVGYGLDYNDYYRNLPDIGVLRPECYKS